MSSRDPAVWMWAEACEMLERAERLHRQFFQPGRSRAGAPAWQPPVDICETPQEFLILVALPGVDAADIEVAVDAGVLFVAGERRLPRAVIHRLEIPYGRFERRIELPEGRFIVERQDLVNGCLLISLRKS